MRRRTGKSPRSRSRYNRTSLLVHPCGARGHRGNRTGKRFVRAVSATGVASISVSETAGFTSALAAWKNAGAANAATMNEYLEQAANDLRASGYAGYGTAIAQLTYLAQLPATNDSPTQQANAHSDVRALDGFFRTPGLLS